MLPQEFFRFELSKVRSPMFLTDFRKTLETGMDPHLKTDSLTFLSTTVSRKISKTREVPSKPRLRITHLQVLSVFQDGENVKFSTMGQCIVTCQNPGEGSLSQFPVGIHPLPNLGLNIDRCIILDRPS